MSSGEPREPPADGPAAPDAKAAARATKLEAKAARRAARRESLRATLRWIRTHYCTIDVRTLGVFRIVLGFLLSADCLRHWAAADWAYSNEGVLSNHYHLFHPSSSFNFSIYHAFSSLPEVHVAFALSFFCYMCFCLGWRSRLFSVLSFVIVTSQDNRLVMVENGGYVVVNLLACWAMFMPTGRRFSIDALLLSYRERRERSALDLADRRLPDSATRPFVSGIVLLATLNVAFIYFFNVVNKSGSIWRWGDTVHYVLHLDRMVTGLAVFVRENVPNWLMKPMSWGTLLLEALIFAWILSPYGRRYTRPLAMLGMWILHGAFGVMMRLGPFSWFMMGWAFLLLTPYQWDDLAAWYRRRAAPRVVVYDGGSPLAFAIARLLVRLDRLELLRFEEGGPDLLLARDPEGERTHGGAAALREIVRALPGGRFVWPILTVLTLGAAGPLLAFASRRREAIARFFGLTLPPRAHRRPAPPTPLGEKLGRARVVAREVVVAYLGLCAVSQAINENKSVPAVFKHTQPRFVQATLTYPRIFQGWGMFAPNPISEDGALSVDAITIDGRHIDPFTGKEPDLDLTDARGLALGQIRQDYFNRIRLDRNKAFRKPQGLQEFLLKYHLRTGRPEDELVAFDVYWVKDQCPKPGDLKPYKGEAIVILSYRKPNYKPAPGLPPLPPPRKEESAGN